MNIKKVLIVDDSKVARMFVGKIIKKLGHEIIGEAQNGQDGFEKYKELKPDIVFSDIEMPILDGYEGLEKIIDFDSNAKVIMITSVVNTQIIQKIMALGAKDSLKKPITEDKLKKIFDDLK